MARDTKTKKERKKKHSKRAKTNQFLQSHPKPSLYFVSCKEIKGPSFYCKHNFNNIILSVTVSLSLFVNNVV